MITRKTESDTVYLKLTFLSEEFLPQDGFKKLELSNLLPPIQNITLVSTDQKRNEETRKINRYPKNNFSVLRIFQAISKGNFDEVNFSIRFVSFEDSYYNNQTASIASLFCDNPAKRKMMIKTIMKWNFNFKSPDLTFLRDPLHWCCILGYKDEFILILDYLNGDIDYHSKDIDGNTYLHLAVISNSIELVKSISKNMIMNCISADICNLLGLTPYTLSRKLGYREISTHLQTTPIASLNVFDNQFHRTPREWSIFGSNLRKKSLKNSKIDESYNFDIFNISDLDDGLKELKNVDVNKIIHSAYFVWANQHVKSFRKLARCSNNIKSKLITSEAPSTQKKC